MSLRIWVIFSLSLALLIFSCVPSAAAVIHGGDAGNLSAPGDNPGWDRVGRVDSAGSGVYLGNGWVITAEHVIGVAADTFTVEGGTTYDTIAGAENGVRLGSTAGAADIDLYMFRVDVSVGNLSGLGDLQIASAAPSNETQGVHMGTGKGQTSSTETTWYVDTSPVDPDPWIWSTSPFGGWDTNAYGYSWDDDASRDTRWNYQHVNNSDYDFWGMEGFTTDFEELSDYGMVADADSGSGFFVKTGITWELAGVAHAVGITYSGQPGSTGVFGNWSIYSDLSAYSGQISDTMAIPEPTTLALLLLGGLTLLRRRRA